MTGHWCIGMPGSEPRMFVQTTEAEARAQVAPGEVCFDVYVDAEITKGARAIINATGDGFIPIVMPFEELVVEKMRKVELYRNERLAAGCTVLLGDIHAAINSNIETKTDLMNAYLEGDIVDRAGKGPFSRRWRMLDNSYLELTTSMIGDCVAQLGAYRDACMQASFAIKDRVDAIDHAAPDARDQLDAIDVTDGYP